MVINHILNGIEEGRKAIKEGVMPTYERTFVGDSNGNLNVQDTISGYVLDSRAETFVSGFNLGRDFVNPENIAVRKERVFVGDTNGDLNIEEHVTGYCLGAESTLSGEGIAHYAASIVGMYSRPGQMRRTKAVLDILNASLKK